LIYRDLGELLSHSGLPASRELRVAQQRHVWWFAKTHVRPRIDTMQGTSFSSGGIAARLSRQQIWVRDLIQTVTFVKSICARSAVQ